MNNSILLDNFSSRELEVLDLLSKGYTNTEIADRLFLSRSTVLTHISNIYSKLNLMNQKEKGSTRVKAVLYYLKNIKGINNL